MLATRPRPGIIRKGKILLLPDYKVGRMPESDQTLITRAQKGDMDSFGTLVERYKSRATWAAYNMVGNYEDALEISQMAFVRVFKALDRFKKGRKFYTWLYQIVTNLSIDHLRKHRKVKKVSIDELPDMDGETDSPEQPLVRQETAENVRLALDDLPEKYKTILVLRDIENLSCKEIGEVVGCSHATVRWRLHRARHLFREIWVNKYDSVKGKRHEM